MAAEVSMLLLATANAVIATLNAVEAYKLKRDLEELYKNLDESGEKK